MPIFDQGYQHWSGRLAGHTWRWLAITRHGLRAAFAGRTIRLVLLLAWILVLLLAAMLTVWGLIERNSELIQAMLPFLGFLDPAILAGPRPYRIPIWTLSYSIFMSAELWFAMVLVLLVGPNLISQDLRYHALPLYFSRPLRRIDYVLGKLGVIVVVLSSVTIVPAILAYFLGLAFSLDLSILRDTFGILLASIAYGLLIAVSAGLLMLALSSLSRNSRYVALMGVGLWIVSSAVAGALDAADREERMHRARGAMRSEESFSESAEDLAAAKRDWRPLISYTENLQRVGRHLLGTDAAWNLLSKLRPAEERALFMMRFRGPQFPWYWSAGVLAALLVLSASILKFTIKSLDRLK